MGGVIFGLVLRLRNILLQLFDTFLTIRYDCISITHTQDIIIIECEQYFRDYKKLSNITNLGITHM